MTALPDVPRLRVAYVIDTMADVRMVEGFAGVADLTVVAPASMEGRITNWWPPHLETVPEIVLIPGGRKAFVLRAARWLAGRGDELDVAVVLDNLTAALGANLGRRAGGPAVILQVGRPTVEYVRCQRGSRPAWRHLVSLLLARLLVAVNERMADAVAAVSQHVATDARRHSSLVRAIPAYGVDTEVFAPRWSREEARRRLGLDPDGQIVMYRSRIAPEKDPDVFLRAVARLRAEGRSIRALYMGGEGDAFAERAGALGVEVELGKPARRDDLPVWYAAADVTVQASKAEGLGLSPVESLACGTPIVVTDVGGLPETVDGGRVGLLVPPGDDQALAEAVASLLDHPDRAAALAVTGRRYVQDRFEAATTFESWVDLGRRAAAVRARRPGAEPRRPIRVLFVDHEIRLSGGERDLVDVVRGLEGDVEAHAAVPAAGPLAEALRRHGAVVHLLPMAESLRNLSRWQLARRPDLAVRRGTNFLAAAWRLRRLIRRLRPDVVHTQSMKAHLLAIALPPIGRRPRLVWRVCDVLEPGWLQRTFHVAAAVGPDRIVCISEAVAAPFRGSRAERKVRVVHCGLRLDPATPGEVDEWRARFGAAPGQPLVGMVGQIARWKGQDTFVEAAGLLAARRPELAFAVCGDCLFPHNEGDFDQAIRRRVEELGLADRFTFVGGRVDHIAPVMEALDLLVHGSRLVEPFGRVLVEAMASGTPVVASPLGATPEIVTPDAGVLVEPGDPAALADAVDALLAEPGPLAEMGRAAQRAARRFDLSAMADGMMDLYGDVLAARLSR